MHATPSTFTTNHGVSCTALGDRDFGALLGQQTLEEFCDAQSAQRDDLDLELRRFSHNVREAVMKSCEDTLYNFLHKAGFNVKARRRKW